MKRLDIRNNELGAIVCVNLDSVASYEIRPYDSDLNEVMLEFLFNCERKARFVVKGKGDIRTIHNLIKFASANGDIFEVEREV